MSEAKRQALQLRRKGMTYHEIGDVMGCSHARAWVMVRDAIKIEKETSSSDFCFRLPPRVRQTLRAEGVNPSDPEALRKAVLGSDWRYFKGFGQESRDIVLEVLERAGYLQGPDVTLESCKEMLEQAGYTVINPETQ